MAQLLAQLDFQEEALDAVAHRIDKYGLYRQIGVAATGLGKTSGIAAHVPRRFEPFVRRQGAHGGLLFIVHRREILRDAAETFRAAYPDKWIGIEMGEEHVVGDEDFIFASADSIGRLMGNRIVKMQHRIFGAVITDEAHHLTVDSKWDNILNYFGVGSDESSRLTLPNGDRPISLMLTATPNRTDGQGLDPFLDPEPNGGYEPAFEYNYPWGVRNGWLVNIRMFWAVDESGVTGAEMANDTEIDYLTRIIRDYGQGEKSLVFARSVEQSAILAATLNERRILRAAHIDGTTDKDLRRAHFEAYKRDEIDLVTNYAVFQEGTNVPGISTIFDNAPTMSPVLGVQKPGRGGRPHPDANVYVLPTAHQRIDAIAKSPKPWLNYVCTYDPRTNASLNVVAALTGKDTEMVPQNGQTIMDVVDMIEYMEEERPDVPIRDVKSIDDLQVRLQEVSIWEDTVYNEDLKAMTKLEWVQSGDDLRLYLPENPFATKAYERVPVVVELRKHQNGRYEQRVIEVGGWNKYTKRVRKATAETKGWADDANAAVRKIDGWLKQRTPSAYHAALRGPNAPAKAATMKYLKGAGIKFAPDITEAAARILAADHRIKNALSNVD